MPEGTIMGNLMLFGAGASFGSDDDRYVPPLGEGLFDALCKFSPRGWGTVPQQFAELFRVDFERGMREFTQAHGGGNTDVLQRAMAGYFFQFRPRAQSLYRTLARRAKQADWDGAFATLNYERLLEVGLRSAGLDVVVGDAPRAKQETELCLPHGSCHLFCKVCTKSPTQDTASRGGPILGVGAHPSVAVVAQVPTILKAAKRADGTEPTTILSAPGPVGFGAQLRLDSEETRIIEDPDLHARELRESDVPPVMCYFQPDKDTRAGVSFIKTQRQRFAKLVGEAKVVGIVGVRVRCHDVHIWGPLRTATAKIIYCAGKSGGQEFLEWAEGVGRRADEILRTYWDEGFDALCSAVGIRPVAGRLWPAPLP